MHRPFLHRFFAPEISAWRGELPLWKVFWIYGVLTSFCIVGLYATAIYAHRPVLRQALLLVFAAYTAWILVSVWRCARNTRNPLWTLLARLLTIAWAANTALTLIFLEIDLLQRFFLIH